MKLSLKNIIRKHKFDFYGVFLRKYPDFILGDHFENVKEKPVFVFHDVTKEYLEPLLQYLSSNGYRTLNADELYLRLINEVPAGKDEVVLTFDDGDRTLWKVAYPLLKKYGLVGIAFIIPGWVGRNIEKGITANLRHSFCTWSEIQEMHTSGVIDIQAHSMYHCQIFISPKIKTFVSPWTDFSSYPIECLSLSDSGNDYRFPETLELGTPIYESAFRLQGYPKYIDSIELRNECVNFVADRGGLEFFKDKSWQKRLNNYAKKMLQRFEREIRFESPEAMENAVRVEFRDAKIQLESKLRGKKVRHYCFPHFVGSSLEIRVSKEEGYVTNFWGGVLPGFAKQVTSPIAIPRMNPVYIYRLPGRGRKPLHKVLYRKYAGAVNNKIKEKL